MIIYSTSESEHEMDCRLLLYVVVCDGTTVLELFTSENETLLIRWYPFLVLYFTFHILDTITLTYVDGDCFTSQCFYKYLHLFMVYVTVSI